MYTAYEKTVKVPQTGLVNYKGKYYVVDSKIHFKTCFHKRRKGKIKPFYSDVIIIYFGSNEARLFFQLINMRY